MNYKHGEARKGAWSPTYKIWTGILHRCKYSDKDAYQYYGARGITVCDRWLIYANFLSDMGPKPEGKSIDRMDSNGNYEPANCRWATPSEQRYNSRPKKPKTHCKRGHLFTPETEYRPPKSGVRTCLICMKEYQRQNQHKYYQRNNEKRRKRVM